MAGSANFTHAGLTTNHENMISINNKSLRKLFKQQFKQSFDNAQDYAPLSAHHEIQQNIQVLVRQCQEAGNLDLLEELLEYNQTSTSFSGSEQCPTASTSAQEPRRDQHPAATFDNIRDKIIAHIDQERESITIAAFALSDREIVRHLALAADKRVRISIVLDSQSRKERILERIADHPLVALNIFNAPATQMRPLMHHKFIIFGNNSDRGRMVLTGSCNLTTSGLTRNHEFLLADHEGPVIDAYQREFRQLWEQSRPINSTH